MGETGTLVLMNSEDKEPYNLGELRVVTSQ